MKVLVNAGEFFQTLSSICFRLAGYNDVGFIDHGAGGYDGVPQHESRQYKYTKQYDSEEYDFDW